MGLDLQQVHVCLVAALPCAILRDIPGAAVRIGADLWHPRPVGTLTVTLLAL